MAHLIVDKEKNQLLIKEWDGRQTNDVTVLNSRMGQIMLKVAYKSPNGTVEYR